MEEFVTDDFGDLDIEETNNILSYKPKKKNNIPRVIEFVPEFKIIECQSTKASTENELSCNCKHWVKRGNCIFGEDCKFLHPRVSIQINIPEKRIGMVPRQPSGKRKRKRTKNRGRAGQFRRWLLTTFSTELLKQGTGILDIAGGQGELSFELVNLNSIQSTIIDPRGLSDFSRLIKKLEKGFFHKNQCLNKLNETAEENKAITHPDHIKLFWGPILWESVGIAAEDPCDIANYNEAYEQFRTKRESINFDKDEYLNQLYQEVDLILKRENFQEVPSATNNDTEEKYKQAEEIEYLLRNCSCIIGLHPDHATEAIVDFAIKLNKPFAIIPCCTCSKQFPNRLRPNKEKVKNYEGLIEHLLLKHEEIKIAHLEFEGKNKILYRLPS